MGVFATSGRTSIASSGVLPPRCRSPRAVVNGTDPHRVRRRIRLAFTRLIRIPRRAALRRSIPTTGVESVHASEQRLRRAPAANASSAAGCRPRAACNCPVTKCSSTATAGSTCGSATSHARRSALSPSSNSPVQIAQNATAPARRAPVSADRPSRSFQSIVETGAMPTLLSSAAPTVARGRGPSPP